MSDMILTTTPYIEGRKVQDYLGIVSGETIIGANVFRDFSPASATSMGVGPLRTRKSSERPKTGLCRNWKKKHALWVQMP